MGNKTASRSADKGSSRAKRGGNTTPNKPVAQTVKIDGELFIRLSTFRARERKTSQEILQQALMEYLDRAGA
ncbi:MAG: hypothetical protein WCF26_02215 [Candidatus Sulfotelmatobacter sp.]